MTGISVCFFMRQPVAAYEFNRTTLKQGTNDGVGIGVVGPADLLQRRAKEVAYGDPLTDMQLPEGIYVHAPRLTQVFIRAF
jgi:hypothetical protein